MYFVVTESGDQLGPHDIPTLKVWVLEGKILPGTPLKEIESDALIKAGELPELFPAEASSSPAPYTPYKSPLPYAREMPGQVTEAALQRGLSQGKESHGPTPKITMIGWASVAAGLLSILFTPYAFMLFSMLSIYLGWKAKSDGHKPSESLVIAGAGSIPLGLVLVFVWEMMKSS